MNDWSTLKKLIWQRGALGGDDGEYITVVGEAPLTLPDAKAAPITSLIQYGKCVTIDGEIYCNCGKIIAVDDELPKGYKRITGIKFDGDFYYDTGITLTGDDEVTMTLANTATGGQNVFGSYNGSGKPNFSLFIYGGGSTSGSYFRYGTQLLRPKFGSNERTITLSGAGTSGFTTDASTSGPEEFETEATAYIGMLPNSTSPGYTGSIIENIEVYNSTTGDLRTWIPCEREEDGVIGYFDMFYYQFLEPIGEGTPVKGEYDVSHLNSYDFEVPTSRLTVGGQSATAFELLSLGDVRDEYDFITGQVTSRVGIEVNEGEITLTTFHPSRTGHRYSLSTVEGDNTVVVTAAPEIGDVELSVTYKKSV